jgi:hypothetical protein
VSEQGFGAARYRARATFRRRWPGYVTLVLMVALVGGLGLGSLAAARRTQSSFSTFLAATNPSDLTVSAYSGGGSTNPDYDPGLTAKIAHLPGVRDVAAGFEVTGAGQRRGCRPGPDRGTDADGHHVAGGVRGQAPVTRRGRRSSGSVPDSTATTTSPTHPATSSGWVRINQCPPSAGRRHM